MKFCSHCGTQVDDDAVLCVKCGCALEGGRRGMGVDAPHAGFAILSLFFPLVGLVLFLTWRTDLPRRAKSCGWGALVGAAAAVLSSVIYWIVTLSLGEPVNPALPTVFAGLWNHLM